MDRAVVGLRGATLGRSMGRLQETDDRTVSEFLDGVLGYTTEVRVGSERAGGGDFRAVSGHTKRQMGNSVDVAAGSTARARIPADRGRTDKLEGIFEGKTGFAGGLHGGRQTR